MTTTELKKKLIDTINNTENATVLQDIERILGLEFDNLPFMVSSEQESAIAEGRNDFRNGDYISNDDANDLTDEWLEK